MRLKRFAVSIIALAAFSVSAFGQGYRIDVDIKHITDSVCYLGYHYGDKRYIKDTAEVVGEKVVFQGEEPLTGGIYFVYTPSIYFEVLINNDLRFSIKTDTTDLIGKMEIAGSPENELFRDLRKYIGQRQVKASELSGKLQEAKGTPQEQEIKNQLMQLEKEVVAYQDGIINDHPSSFVATILKATRRPEIPEPPKDASGKPVDPDFQFNYYKSHFFDHIDFKDPRILRTNFFHGKITEYLEKLTHQHPDSISKAAQFIIDQAEGNEDMYRYLVVTLTGKYETSEIMGMDKVFVDLAEKYYLSGKASWADSSVLDKIREKVNDTKPNLIGSKAPQLVLYDSLKRPVNAHSVKAKFTILYFFDPDCGHCRKSAPKLRDAYPEFKERGAEVVAVSTLTDLSAMSEFVHEFDLPFLTLADLAGQRKPYNIFSTPVIYILDEDKTIIAKRLEIDQISGFLDHQLKMQNMQGRAAGN